MKLKILLLVVSGMFLLASCEKDLVKNDDGSSPLEKSAIDGVGMVVNEMIHSEALEGNLFGDPATRAVNIYLPKSYYTNPEKRFPVIYYLHGLPAWENSLLEPLPYAIVDQVANLTTSVDFPLEGFDEWANNLIDNEGMREAIIVMPDAKTHFGPSFYTNSQVLGNYEDYIVNDLVSFVDNHYRTIPHFNWRAITGHSAGGYGALRLAMINPHVFGRVAGLSPGQFPDQMVIGLAQFMLMEDQLWLQEFGVPPGPDPYYPTMPFKFMNNTFYSLAASFLPNPNNGPYYADIPFSYDADYSIILNEALIKKWNSQSLFSLATENEIGLKKLKTIYFDCGINDDLYMYGPNLAFHELLSQMKIKHEFSVHDGTHFSQLFNQLGKVWTDISNDFPEYE